MPQQLSINTTYPTTGGATHTTITPYQTGWTDDQWWDQHKIDIAHDRAHGYPLVPPGS